MPNNGYFDTIFASSGDVSPVPDAPQGSGSVSYTQGYTAPYSLAPTNPDAILVGRANFNQLLKDITTAIQFIQQNGQSNFITTAMNGGVQPYAYNEGATVMYDAGSGLVSWVSTADENITVPGAEGASWNQLAAPSSALFTGGTSTGGANAQAVDTTQGGFVNEAGNILTVLSGVSNTAAMTITPDETTALTVKVMTKTGLRDTVQGDFVATGQYIFVSDGTYLILANSTNYMQANLNGADILSPSTFLANIGGLGLVSNYAVGSYANFDMSNGGSQFFTVGTNYSASTIQGQAVNGQTFGPVSGTWQCTDYRNIQYGGWGGTDTHSTYQFQRVA